MSLRKDTLVSGESSGKLGVQYDVANPMYVETLQELTKANEMLLQQLSKIQQGGQISMWYSVVSKSSGKSLQIVLQEAISNNNKVISQLQEMKQDIDEASQAIMELRERVGNVEGRFDSPDPESQMGGKWAVVLTFNPQYADCRGKTADQIRKSSKRWLADYIKKHNIDVIGGPWMDDVPGMSQPHVNLTIRPNTPDVSEFKFWKYRKGYVYISPVVSDYSWETYASRNHETCESYLMGNISRDEANSRMLGKPRRSKEFSTSPPVRKTISTTSTKTLVYDDD